MRLNVKAKVRGGEGEGEGEGHVGPSWRPHSPVVHRTSGCEDQSNLNKGLDNYLSKALGVSEGVMEDQ